jgi:hypothetical protein
LSEAIPIDSKTDIDGFRKGSTHPTRYAPMTRKERPMCYRPRPDLKRTPASKPTADESDRRLQKLEAELALLREEIAVTAAVRSMG